MGWNDPQDVGKDGQGAPDSALPLYRQQFQAAEMVARYPPQWEDVNKEAVFRLSCPPGCRHTGTLCVSRWAPMPLPRALDPEANRTELVVQEGLFDYTPALPPPAVEWHLNFAACDLFCAYGGGLFAQDEMQVAEHPALGSVREVLLATGLSTQTVEGSEATPILIRGVERRCRIATDPNPAEGRPRGLYGNDFAIADVKTIRRAVTVLEPPSVSNILAIEAPAYGSGLYLREEIERILVTAFSGFRAARLESRGPCGSQRPVVIHTGFWGCGAYGGDRTLMVLLQLLCGQLAGVDMLVFHTFDPIGTDALRTAVGLLAEITGGRTQPVAMDQIIPKIEAKRFRWGVSDGN